MSTNNYCDIPPEIRPFVEVTEGEFDSYPEFIKEAAHRLARERWLKAGAPRSDSVRYPLVDSVDDHELDGYTVEELVKHYYEEHIKSSTVGIEDHRFVLQHPMNIPSPWQYVSMISHMATKLRATNATVQYIDSDDVLHNLSFSRNDLNNHTVEDLLEILRKGLDEWRNNGLYAGSDYIINSIATYSLSMRQFTITVCHTRGGYGKMIPDYYDTLGLENNGHDCLIQCFLYIHSKEHPYAKPLVADRIREVLSQKGKLGLETVPILEEMFQVEVDVLRDQRVVEIELDHPEEMMNMSIRLIINRIKEFKAKVKRDEPVVIYGTGSRKWQLLHKDEHYDIITKTYPASECHCEYTGEQLVARRPLSKGQLRQKMIERCLSDYENLTSYGGSDSEQDEDGDNVWYYFFDYETVFDQQSMEILPYAYAIVKCNRKFEVVHKQCHIGMGCDQDLSTYLYKETPHKGEKKYLIGYNNSRFDNFLLIKHSLQHNDYVGRARFNGNTIVSAEINGFVVRDLCRILNMSLDNACKSFKIDLPKLTGAVKHHEVQMRYMNGESEFLKYLMSAQDTIREYVVRDCECLSKLYKITKQTIGCLVGLDLETKYTLAGMSYTAFKKTLSDRISEGNSNSKKTRLCIISNIMTDKFIRKAIIGGRSQMLTTKRELQDLCAIDCVSLYPYVMLNRQYPIGMPINTKKYMPGKIGIYNVTIHSQCKEKHNVVPLRKDDADRLDWLCKGEIECVLCSVDIECLKQHGGKVTVKDGIYWKETTNTLFDQYFKPLIIEKKNQDVLRSSSSEVQRNIYNPAIRETCKLLMNSLSGKLAQRLYNTETEILRNANDVDRFCNRTISGTQTFVKLGPAYIGQGRKEPTPTTPCVYGVLIYAYAREHMYENVLRHLRPDELYGMDTDSAFITHECLNRVDKHLMGDDFGQFKVELDHCDGIFIAPKCYIFYTGGSQERHEGNGEANPTPGPHGSAQPNYGEELLVKKARFKGVKVGMDIELPDDVDTEDTIALYKAYHSSKSTKVGLNTFKRLLVDRKCDIVCCNIDKLVSAPALNTGLYLANHTFVKEIKLEDELDLLFTHKDTGITVTL